MQGQWQPPPLLPESAPARAAPAASDRSVPAPSTASDAARFELRLDSGSSIRVSGPVLLGRNPDAADSPGAHPIAVPDETRSLSKTHALVRPVEGGLEIVDWHSTNGSSLISGGVERSLPAGVAVRAAEGDRIRFGSRVADVIRL